MRISTHSFYQRALDGMLKQQNRLSRTQEQLGSGIKNPSPSDDPSAAVRQLSLDQNLSVTTQYQRNIDYAEAQLNLEDTTLANLSDLLQRARELAVRGNNATVNMEERQAIAAEVHQIGEEVLAASNTRDSSGSYLFAGHQAKTVPFSGGGAAPVVYQGDQGQRMVQIGPTRQLATSDPGTSVFLEIPTSGGGEQDLFGILSDLATSLDVGGGGSTDSIGNIDSALSRVLDVRAGVGARLNTLDAQRSANDSFKLGLQTMLSRVHDLDYTSAVTQFNEQLLALQAAEQSYAKLQGLSLFNFVT